MARLSEVHSPSMISAIKLRHAFGVSLANSSIWQVRPRQLDVEAAQESQALTSISPSVVSTMTLPLVAG